MALNYNIIVMEMDQTYFLQHLLYMDLKIIGTMMEKHW